MIKFPMGNLDPTKEIEVEIDHCLQQYLMEYCHVAEINGCYYCFDNPRMVYKNLGDKWYFIPRFCLPNEILEILIEELENIQKYLGHELHN